MVGEKTPDLKVPKKTAAEWVVASGEASGAVVGRKSADLTSLVSMGVRGL